MAYKEAGAFTVIVKETEYERFNEETGGMQTYTKDMDFCFLIELNGKKVEFSSSYEFDEDAWTAAMKWIVSAQKDLAELMMEAQSAKCQCVWDYCEKVH